MRLTRQSDDTTTVLDILGQVRPIDGQLVLVRKPTGLNLSEPVCLSLHLHILHVWHYLYLPHAKVLTQEDFPFSDVDAGRVELELEFLIGKQFVTHIFNHGVCHIVFCLVFSWVNFEHSVISVGLVPPCPVLLILTYPVEGTETVFLQFMVGIKQGESYLVARKYLAVGGCRREQESVWADRHFQIL